MADNTEAERRGTTENLDTADKLEKFKADIVTDADDLSEQRDLANEDMRFLSVPGGMWENFLSDDWDSRTKLEFDQTSDYVNRFLGEWDQNRVGVEYKPDDHKTSDEDAELLNGIYRADFREESGKMSTDNAVDEASTCGYGCFKLATKFVDEEDPENDMQRVEWRPIHNAYNMVIWDNASLRIDKRDARRCTVLEPFTPDSFKEIYKDASPISAYVPHTRSFNDFSIAKKNTIYIATRYEVVRRKTLFHIYGNLTTNQTEVYSEDDHELVKDELRKSKFHKKIRERVMIQQLAENSASSGQDVPIFDPDQMPDNIAALWADRNNKPYMLAKSLVDADGNIVQHGPLGYLKPPQLDGSTAALLQIVPQHIQNVTGGAPQDTVDPDASGKAILALQKRENLKTATVMDNIKNAIEWSGEVYQSIAAEIYNSKRIVRTLGNDGTEAQQQLFKEMVDEKTGKIVRGNSLRGKKFRAFSDVGPAYETLREQMVEDVKGMMALFAKSQDPALQKYSGILASVMMENISGPGMQQLKEVVRRDMLMQGIRKPETDEEKQLMAQIQEQQNQPSKQDQLLQAATQQAASEGEKFLSEARNLDSKSIDNVASARKKAAETRKILAEIGQGNAKVMNDLIQTSLKRAEGLPFSGNSQ